MSLTPEDGHLVDLPTGTKEPQKRLNIVPHHALDLGVAFQPTNPVDTFR